TIERVAKIVGPRSDDVLAKPHSDRLQPTYRFRSLRLDPALHRDGPLQRKALVELLGSGLAGMADDGQARTRRRAFARDEAHPHRVLTADLRIGEEHERSWPIEKLHRQAVRREPERDDFRKGLFGLVVAPELRV